ncbi:hypothetical protein ACE5NI_18400 [Clostridioides difficile]
MFELEIRLRYPKEHNIAGVWDKIIFALPVYYRKVNHDYLRNEFHNNNSVKIKLGESEDVIKGVLYKLSFARFNNKPVFDLIPRKLEYAIYKK